MHGLEHDGQDVGDAPGGRAEPAVARELALEVGDALRALGARPGGLLGDAPLGRQLALELRAPDGGLALLGRLAALLHQPRGLALGLLGLGEGALGVARARARPRRATCRRPRRRAPAASTPLPASCSACTCFSDSAISASRWLRIGQDALGAALGGLLQLARRAEPGAAGRRDGHAA